MRALGIDLASGKTGLVLLADNGTPKPELLFEQVLSFPLLKGIENQRAVITRIMELVHEKLVPGDRIVIEGYSLNMKNAASVVPLVEIGGLLRFMLNTDGLKWLDPRASEVKKFVSGKGTTPKNMMVAHVLQRWGHMPKDDNTADAFVLACMGLAHANKLPGVTKEMRAIVGGLAMRSN